jgi:predicted nucleic acid-binding protein
VSAATSTPSAGVAAQSTSGAIKSSHVAGYVVDASVIVKLFNAEPGTSAARALLAGNRKLVAPSQIAVEVAAAILRRAREGTIRPEQARRALDAWITMLKDGVVEITDNRHLFEQAIDLSLSIRHALPDCLYLSLAREHGVPLLTFDVKQAERGAAHCTVQRLSTDD